MPNSRRKNIHPEDANAGRVLGHVMNVRNMTQTQLAERVGMHQTSVSRLLKGENGWSPHIMAVLAAELGVDSTIFLEDSDAVLARLQEALKFARELELPGQMGYAA